MTPNPSRRARDAIHHPPTACAVSAERAFLRRLEGGCQVPVAAFGELDTSTGRLSLRGRVVSLAGEKSVEGVEEATVVDERDGDSLGTALAERLLSLGAAEILASVRAAAPRWGVGALMSDAVVVTAAEGSFPGLIPALRAIPALVEEHPLIAFEPPLEWGPVDDAIRDLEPLRRLGGDVTQGGRRRSGNEPPSACRTRCPRKCRRSGPRGPVRPPPWVRRWPRCARPPIGLSESWEPPARSPGDADGRGARSRPLPLRRSPPR